MHLVYLILLFFYCHDIYPQSASEVNHAFHNTFVFGFDGGLTFAQTDYQKEKMGYAFRGFGEYYFNTNSIHLLGLKLKLSTEQIKGEDDRGEISSNDGLRPLPPIFSTSIYTAGVAAIYSISINDVLFPYFSAGISNIWFFPMDENDKPAAGGNLKLYEKSTIGYSFEVGVKYLVSDRLSINLSVNPYLPQTDYLDDISAALQKDAYTTILLGFSYSPFTSSEPKLEDVKVPVVIPVQPEDTEVETEIPIDQTIVEDSIGTKEQEEIIEEEVLMGEQKFLLVGDDIFSPNSAMIKIEGKSILDDMIRQLQKYGDKKWRIEGHMDSNGSKRFLRNLSLERAKAVLEYFSYFGGLKRENFQVFGMGDNFPIGDNNTEEGRRQNRRIEITPEE
jgi:outer membrane protein OmpA-like peptidoglycan-associated protein/opacity protein-like surface antigen